MFVVVILVLTIILWLQGQVLSTRSHLRYSHFRLLVWPIRYVDCKWCHWMVLTRLHCYAILPKYLTCWGLRQNLSRLIINYSTTHIITFDENVDMCTDLSVHSSHTWCLCGLAQTHLNYKLGENHCMVQHKLISCLFSSRNSHYGAPNHNIIVMQVNLPMMLMLNCGHEAARQAIAKWRGIHPPWDIKRTLLLQIWLTMAYGVLMDYLWGSWML